MKRFLFFTLILFTFLVFSVQSMLASDFVVENTYSLTNAQNTTQIAELTLSQIAERDANSRKITGYSLAALGAGIASVSFIVDEPDAIPALLFAGGVTTGIGVIILAIPSTSEREYAKVLECTSLEEREFLAEKSLAYLSDKEHGLRMINGFCSAGMAIYYLYCFTQDYEKYSYSNQDSARDLYCALGMAGTAIYEFLVPSYVEKAYQEVLEEKSAKVSFKFGELTGLVASISF